MLILQNYTVRYETDGDILAVHFAVPRGTTGAKVVILAAGILFLGDCCPGEKFCVYKDNDRSKPIMPGNPEAHHHYYGDHDSLWNPKSEVTERTFGE